MYQSFLDEFKTLTVIKGAVLKKYNSFRVGGRADLLVFPSTVQDFQNVLTFIKGKFNYYILGAGSNVLVSEKGFHGIVISTENLRRIKLNGSILTCECGAKMADVIKFCQDNSFGGLEFLVGIPGSVGGMVAMNAGCFNKSISDYICYVVGENGIYNKKTCCFDYRSSRFLDGEAVFKVAFKLKVSEQETIEYKISKFLQTRRKTQPKGRSCGSCFLNEGFFAGKVIDSCNLKGYRIGGAFISNEHANFIISENATADDIYKLINHVKKVVYETTGTILHEEIKYVGEF